MYIDENGVSTLTDEIKDFVNQSKIPTGGTAGQVLTKVDGTDYNTEWATPSSGNAVTLNGDSQTFDGDKTLIAKNKLDIKFANANSNTKLQLLETHTVSNWNDPQVRFYRWDNTYMYVSYLKIGYFKPGIGGNELYLPERQGTLLTQETIIPAYSTTTQYYPGDIVVRNGSIYKCVTKTYGTWVYANWTNASPQFIYQFQPKLYKHHIMLSDSVANAQVCFTIETRENTTLTYNDIVSYFDNLFTSLTDKIALECSGMETGRNATIWRIGVASNVICGYSDQVVTFADASTTIQDTIESF